ncbi:efflux RND transporter periplasmic adaptor subunit [Pelobacter seleniigenes]|uniref:efflux RND transporter periplasmic adaptor subunit n=1 Tax=Pelobacter seleniigenes TaxID=407188 RepID=UPI0004A70B73|nr:efflux RND transporter periplasmic adaptor subunit [Pelobacter seleniigenes]
MKRKNYITLALVAAIIGLGAYALLHFEPGETVAGKTASDSSSAPESLISTAYPTKRTFPLQVHWVGTVESQASIELAALVAGRVESIDAEDQRPVKMGQSVIRLGGPQIEDTRARLTAQIESLETQVQLSQETLVRLEENLKTRLATKDQVAAAQEAKVRLETQLRDARLNLTTLNRQSRITASMKGIFTNRRVSVGQGVAAGQVIGDVIDTDRLRVKASLFPPRDLELQGREAAIRLSESQTITGIVRQVLPMASGTGAVTVWIEGPQIDAQLRPGQTVGGEIVAQSKSGVLAVPESAIVYDPQDHPFLFVGKDGTYERLSIQTGMTQDGWIEVLSGLKEDQLVVVRGAYELFYRKFNEQFKVQD